MGRRAEDLVAAMKVVHLMRHPLHVGVASVIEHDYRV
jgi:hypothetical protein